MSSERTAAFEAGDDEIPAGAAPKFGEGDTSPTTTPNHLVLSASEHQRLSELPLTRRIAGRFSIESPPLRGRLRVSTGTAPGLVHLHADLESTPSGAMYFDAEVRESWLAAAAGDDPEQAPVRVVRALAEVAEIPHQRTVEVGFAK